MGQDEVYEVLKRTRRWMTTKDIAKEIGSNKTVVNISCRKLFEKGLLERRIAGYGSRYDALEHRIMGGKYKIMTKSEKKIVDDSRNLIIDQKGEMPRIYFKKLLRDTKEKTSSEIILDVACSDINLAYTLALKIAHKMGVKIERSEFLT